MCEKGKRIKKDRRSGPVRLLDGGLCHPGLHFEGKSEIILLALEGDQAISTASLLEQGP